jgi:hypothetical protein
MADDVTLLDSAQADRRRRQQLFLAVGGSGVVVAAIAVGVLIGARGGGDGSLLPVAQRSSQELSEIARKGLGCGADGGGFGAAPAPADLEEQRALVAEIEAKDWGAFSVVYAETNPLGVVALVSGDLGAAKTKLTEAGVRAVWTDGSGGPEQQHSQAMVAVQQELDGASADVDQARAGLSGYGQTALWQEAGAVVVTWKAPVPQAITQLQEPRPDGVQVVVVPLRYSGRAMARAVDRAIAAFRDHEVSGTWYDASPCDDGTGIRLGVPRRLTHDTVLSRRLTRLVGMPVHLVVGSPSTTAPDVVGGTVDPPDIVTEP